ncbi:MAG: 2-polyprenyl-3-methyl-6-methoxy-1,4-benzoquinone monooxygenase [Gammaproteobacteria bacterium]
MNQRSTSPLDELITGFDQTLRQLSGRNLKASRPTPGQRPEEPETLSREQKVLAGRLMRVNHAGEVAAQALYKGQALATNNETVKTAMKEAAAEETDHLVWCQERLDELNAKPSVLNPLWYAGSFALGFLAGKAGDDWSLGFVGETERQVEQHLDHHLDRLPESDQRSRDIIEVMKEDEARHGQTAMDAGGRELPSWAQGLMRLTSKVMTRGAYWL